MFKEFFIIYLKDKGLKTNTITNYTDRIANNGDVQNLIYKITGMRKLFDISDSDVINTLYSKIKDSEIDIVGHRMYSCGIHHYLKFILTNKDTLLKQEIIKTLL